MTGLFNRALIALSLFTLMPSAFAGAYIGAETGDNNQSLVFAGAQSEGTLFAAIFLGKLRYSYEEAGQDIKATSNMVTPKVGFQWSGPVTISLSIGATWEDKQEHSTHTTDSRSTGAYAQLGAFYRRENYSAQFLLSYTANTKFMWNRVRIKQKFAGAYSLGGEVFHMGNEDFNARGMGMLAEKKWSGFSSTLKLGVNATSSNNHGMYGGLEFYIPF